MHLNIQPLPFCNYILVLNLCMHVCNQLHFNMAAESCMNCCKLLCCLVLLKPTIFKCHFPIMTLLSTWHYGSCQGKLCKFFLTNKPTTTTKKTIQLLKRQCFSRIWQLWPLVVLYQRLTLTLSIVLDFCKAWNSLPYDVVYASSVKRIWN